MERHFEKDLNEMKERLLWMGSLAERSVHQSVHAVLESDEQLANRVLEEEDAINELQMEIDDRVVQLLALHQLMAIDLRFVLAQTVLATDDRVDNYRDQIFRELLTYMMGDSSVVFPAFELILVAKNLERIGDHATNIAEDVIYLVQGQDIRHPTVDRR